MKWISVKDELPPEEEIILYGVVFYGELKISLKHAVVPGWRDNDVYWRDYRHTIRDVTHWMPLPESPNKVNRIKRRQLLQAELNNLKRIEEGSEGLVGIRKIQMVQAELVNMAREDKENKDEVD